MVKVNLQMMKKLFMQRLNEVDPSEDEVRSAMSGQIPDEMLDEIMNLSDEELQMVLQQYPQLEEMLTNNME